MPDAWDAEALRELRGSLARRDSAGILAALHDRPLDEVLQLAGDGVRLAVEARVHGAPDLARACTRLLRARDEPGDRLLAEELEAATGERPVSELRSLTIDLDELSSCLEGDPLNSGGRIDLRSGDVWPAPVYRDSWSDDEEDEDDADAEHWLYFDCHGSRDSYRDMQVFIDTVDDAGAVQRLSAALHGRRAFRRFRDVLHDSDEQIVDRWNAFSEDRRRGRARAWLASVGYRPVGRDALAPTAVDHAAATGDSPSRSSASGEQRTSPT